MLAIRLTVPLHLLCNCKAWTSSVQTNRGIQHVSDTHVWLIVLAVCVYVWSTINNCVNKAFMYSFSQRHSSVHTWHACFCSQWLPLPGNRSATSHFWAYCLKFISVCLPGCPMSKQTLALGMLPNHSLSLQTPRLYHSMSWEGASNISQITGSDILFYLSFAYSRHTRYWCCSSHGRHSVIIMWRTR